MSNFEWRQYLRKEDEGSFDDCLVAEQIMKWMFYGKNAHRSGCEGINWIDRETTLIYSGWQPSSNMYQAFQLLCQLKGICGNSRDPRWVEFTRTLGFMFPEDVLWGVTPRRIVQAALAVFGKPVLT
jgi:hypothetical protein